MFLQTFLANRCACKLSVVMRLAARPGKSAITIIDCIYSKLLPVREIKVLFVPIKRHFLLRTPCSFVDISMSRRNRLHHR